MRARKTLEDRRRVVGPEQFEQARHIVGRAVFEQRSAQDRLEFCDALHRQRPVLPNEEIEGLPAMLIGEPPQDAGDIDRMPLPKQVEQVIRGSGPQQAHDRLQDYIAPARRYVPHVSSQPAPPGSQ